LAYSEWSFDEQDRAAILGERLLLAIDRPHRESVDVGHGKPPG